MRFVLPLLFCSTLFAANTPVLVELFTSEGCSSCPSADSLLMQLDKAQPIPGVEVIALEEHVDYWNYLGWSDPFSSAAFSGRQRDYAKVLPGENVYTPQMVINGSVEFVGSNSGRARAEIERAARQPQAKVQLTPAKGQDNISFSLRVEDLPARTNQVDVLLAITESNLATNVRSGENGGRRLAHSGVVRTLVNAGKIDPKKDGTFSAEAQVPLAKSWKRENLRAVLFVQDHVTKKVLGVAAVSL